MVAEKILGNSKSLVGQSLSAILQDSSFTLVKNCELGEYHREHLVFNGQGGAAIKCESHIFASATRSLIIGEKPMLSHEEIVSKMGELNTDLVNLTRELHFRNRELEQAQETIEKLRGILPICAYCKGIRNDKGYWDQLEDFITTHHDVGKPAGLHGRRRQHTPR